MDLTWLCACVLSVARRYVIIRFFCAFITCTVEYMRDEGMGNHHKIEQTITAIIIIINLSQIWALFCLVQVHTHTPFLPETRA